MEATDKTKVLWNGDSYRTLLDASWAFAAASEDRVFASSVSSKLSAVGFVNGRATAENFLTADHVKELLQRAFLILEPVLYVPAKATARLHRRKCRLERSSSRPWWTGKRKDERSSRWHGPAKAWRMRSTLRRC